MKRLYIKDLLKRILFRREIIKPFCTPVFQSELLVGRKALVTGGTSGIGYSIAIAFINAGAAVTITGRKRNHLDMAVKNIQDEVDVDAKSRISGIVLDNRNIKSFDDKITEIMSRMDGLDILVNNAGLVKGHRFGDDNELDFVDVMDTNLKGPYFLSQTITNIWKEKNIKGNVVNICSSSSLRPANSAYILSKWGMRALTLGMAKDLIKYGIVVNGLAPGPTNTPHFVGDGNCGIAWPNNPSNRLATMCEIANLAVILASNIGNLIVGDVVYASGGAGVITFDDV